MRELLRGKDVVYKSLEDEHIDEASRVLAKVFCENEFLVPALKITQDEFYTFAKPCCEKAAKEKISIVGVDQNTDKIVSVL